MTTLNLSISDDLKNQLQARAAESGYATVEQYAEALLRADAQGEFLDEQTEKVVLDRLDDPRPGIEFTKQFKDEFRQQVVRRRAQP